MIEATNETGQVLTLLLLVAFLAVWVAVAARRQRVRDRQRMRRLARLSGVRPSVGHTRVSGPTTEDRSEG